MLTECSPDLFGFALVEGRSVVAEVHLITRIEELEQSQIGWNR